MRMGRWVYRFRVLGALGWLLCVYVFDWTMPLVGVASYLAFAVLSWVGARKLPSLRRQPDLGVWLLDMPALFLIQSVSVAVSPEASVIAGLSVGLFILLVMLMALLGTSWSRLVLATGMGIALETELARRAGHDVLTTLPGVVLLLALAAMVAGFTRRQMHRLVLEVS
ncbi:MAG: adenylate/guanylate cyclase domain-containing protein, partial [Cystobacter sp.]